MDPDLPWEEVYRRLIEEAPYIEGDSGEDVDGTQIKWADLKLIEEGRQFFLRNQFSMNLSASAALILGFSIKNLSTVLLRTGNFTGTVNSMDRYIDTEDHLLHWYMFDTFHKYGEGYKGLQIVRKMHSLALRKCMRNNELFIPDETNVDKREEKLKFIQALKEDLACVDTSEAPNHLNTYNPKVLMNQFDMAMTQYGFFALIYMYPRSFGIYDTKGLDGFTHLWAVLGRLLGIQDRYNLALYPNRQLFAKIHDQIGVAAFKQVDLNTANLQFSFAEALGKMMHHNLSAPALFYFSFNSKTSIPQFKGDNLSQLFSWRELIILKLVGLLLFLMSYVWIINYSVNSIFPTFAAKNRTRVLTDRKKRQQKQIMSSSQRA